MSAAHTPHTSIPHTSKPGIPAPPSAGGPGCCTACCTGWDRRTALLAAGAAGAAVVLAGCSAADDIAGGAIPSATDAASSAVRDAISPASIPVGGGRVFPDQKVVVTQPTEGQFRAFTSVCTHQGCPVTDVSGGTINCPCHGSRFDVATGEVRQGPATRALPQKQVTVTAEGLTVS